MAEQYGSNSIQTDQKTDTELIYNHSLKYLIGISIRTNAPWEAGVPVEKSKSKRIVLSATVLQFGDVWVLATAGHIVKGLEETHKHGYDLEIKLIDNWAKEGSDKSLIQYQFDPSMTFHISDENLDFGFIHCSDYIRKLLEANGVQAIGPEHWMHAPDDDLYQTCGLIGIPSKTFEIVRKNSDAISLCVNPTLIALEHKFIIPQEINEREAPYWLGRVDRDKLDVDHGDIDGMSGGPVFGIFKKENGTVGYHMIGLQSAVKKDSHYLYFYVTQFWVIFRLMEHYRKQIDNNEVEGKGGLPEGGASRVGEV